MKAYPDIEDLWPDTVWPLEESEVTVMAQRMHPGCVIRIVKTSDGNTVQVWDPVQRKYVANYKYGRK